MEASPPYTKGFQFSADMAWRSAPPRRAGHCLASPRPGTGSTWNRKRPGTGSAPRLAAGGWRPLAAGHQQLALGVSVPTAPPAGNGGRGDGRGLQLRDRLKPPRNPMSRRRRKLLSEASAPVPTRCGSKSSLRSLHFSIHCHRCSVQTAQRKGSPFPATQTQKWCSQLSLLVNRSILLKGV